MQQVVEPFERDVGTVGDDDAARLPLDLGYGVEQFGVYAVRNNGKALPGNPEIPGDVLPGAFGDGDDPAKGARYPFLHADEGEPAQVLDFFPKRPHRTHGDVPVNRDGVVDGGHGGNLFGDGPDAVRQALIVVNDVVALHPGAQKALGTDAEGKGFGKPHGRDTRPFHDIDRVAQLPEGGNPKQTLRIVQVQAGRPVGGDVRVQTGIRRAGKHFDVVADIFECPAQVFQVNTLASAVGIAPVAQQADVKGTFQAASHKR